MLLFNQSESNESYNFCAMSWVSQKYIIWYSDMGLLWWQVVKNLPPSAGDARDAGSILESGRFPGVGSGNPRQYSCLENSMERGAWWATVCGVAKSQTQLSVHTIARVRVHTHTQTHTLALLSQSVRKCASPVSTEYYQVKRHIFE